MKLMAAIFLFLLGVLAGSVMLRWDLYESFWDAIAKHDSISAVLISASFAAFIAIWGIFSQRAISRRVFTLTYISRGLIDKDLIDANKIFVGLPDNRTEMENWANKENDSSNEAKSVRLVLNDYELISIGIQRGVIDFEMYKMWYRTGTINMWNKAEPFIVNLRRRESNPMLYHEFESLVKWLIGTKKPKRGYFLGHWFT